MTMNLANTSEALNAPNCEPSTCKRKLWCLLITLSRIHPRRQQPKYRRTPDIVYKQTKDVREALVFYRLERRPVPSPSEESEITQSIPFLWTSMINSDIPYTRYLLTMSPMRIICTSLPKHIHLRSSDTRRRVSMQHMTKTIPDGWSKRIHPEGTPYYLHNKIKPIPNSDVCNPDIQQDIEWYGVFCGTNCFEIDPKLANFELVIEPHSKERAWCEPGFLVDCKGVNSLSHIKFGVEAEYWYCAAFMDVVKALKPLLGCTGIASRHRRIVTKELDEGAERPSTLLDSWSTDGDSFRGGFTVTKTVESTLEQLKHYTLY
ncbi:hypothetical protein BU15DRAFT_68442 [Melanogaster broomeanus]|nr:hypothetical protein BU15DRAFT_68442 [Melanogaster broomeanus]